MKYSNIPNMADFVPGAHDGDPLAQSTVTVHVFMGQWPLHGTMAWGWVVWGPQGMALHDMVRTGVRGCSVGPEAAPLLPMSYGICKALGVLQKHSKSP